MKRAVNIMKTKNKIISFLTAATLSIAAFSCPAAMASDNLFLYNAGAVIYNGGSITILSCDESAQTAEIPGKSEDDFIISDVEDGAFKNCTELVEITVSEDNPYLTSEDGVLFNADKTELIAYPQNKSAGEYTVPKTVKKIRSDAFYGTSDLHRVYLPDGLESIGEEAFSGCVGLETISIPDTVKTISSACFKGCTALSSIKLSSSIETIADSTFEDCHGLAGIIIPDSVTSIGCKAFKDCTAMQTIELSKNLTSIDANAFEHCSILGEIVIPDGVTCIKTETFLNCTYLYSVTLSSNLTVIEDNAFGHCTNLGNITLPDSLLRIENGVFSECTALSEIVVPENVSSIGYEAFSDCNSLKKIVILNPDCVIYGYDSDDVLGSNTIPENTVIDCPAGSNAMKYALNYGRNIEIDGKKVVPGDANYDGNIDSKDATAILVDYAKTMLGKQSELVTASADINGDGKADSKDATAILVQYAKSLLG